MPTALTVAGLVMAMVPPLALNCALPNPGIGVLPSVVYQMPVLASRPPPGLVNVTVTVPEILPLAGEMVGATEVCTQVGILVSDDPVAVAGPSGMGFSVSFAK